MCEHLVVRPEVEAFLRDHGASDAEVAAAAVGDPRALVELVLTRAVLPGPREFSLAEAAAEVGAGVADVARIWRALGFPDPGEEAVFTRQDVTALTGALSRVGGPEDLDKTVQQARVIGAAMAAVAETWTDGLVRGVEQFRRSGLTYEDVVLALVDDLDIERVSPIVEHLHRRQLVAAIQRRLWWSEAGPLGGTALAVGFADLAGYTALSAQLGDDELAALVDRFEAVTGDVIAAHGARVVKQIGDAVLFVAPTLALGLAVGLGLVEVVGRDAMLPPVRVGLDHGEVLLRDGDVYGPVVNRASRLTDVARPSTVVVAADATGAALAAGFGVERLGSMHLKDLGAVEVWAVARLGAAAPEAAGEAT